MLEKERQKIIMELLEMDGFVSVRNLMDTLQVSRSSVMRDLIDLEKQGKLNREHGGAALKTGSIYASTEKKTSEKAELNASSKKAVCREAAKELTDGECVYIDSGTTAAYMVPFLDKKDLMLVTPSIFLIRHLPDSFRGQIVLLGGSYDRKYDMSSGALTVEMLERFNFDHAFMTANGFSIRNNEVYVSTFELGAVKKKVMERCRKVDLLVDSTKKEVHAVCTFASLDDMHAVYVDDGLKDKDLPDNFVICKIGK